MRKLTRLLRCACCLGAVALSTTLFGQAARTPQPAPTTQQATIKPTAFAPDDPLVTPELAKAVAPRLVSLKVQNVPALTAFTELAKQSGYEIRPGYDGMFTQRQRGHNLNVTLDIQNQPFWVVVREIGSRGSINLYDSGGSEDRTIQIAPGNYGGDGALRAAASIRGPFLVVVGDLQRVNSVNMAKPGEVDRKIAIQIRTYVEPKIVASQVSYEPVIEEAVDDNGNSMNVPPREHDNMQSGRGVAWYGHFQLPYPTTNPGKRIAKIKGHIPATIQMASEPMEIADPLKASETTKTLGKRKVTFKSLTKNGDNYNLALVFYRDANADNEAYNRLWNETIPMKLTDANNRAFRYYNSGGSGSGDSITRNFTFQPPSGRTGANKPGEPTKLTIEVPTGTMEIAIPFELVNLPMP